MQQTKVGIVHESSFGVKLLFTLETWPYLTAFYLSRKYENRILVDSLWQFCWKCCGCYHRQQHCNLHIAHTYTRSGKAKLI